MEIRYFKGYPILYKKPCRKRLFKCLNLYDLMQHSNNITKELTFSRYPQNSTLAEAQWLELTGLHQPSEYSMQQTINYYIDKNREALSFIKYVKNLFSNSTVEIPEKHKQYLIGEIPFSDLSEEDYIDILARNYYNLNIIDKYRDLYMYLINNIKMNINNLQDKVYDRQDILKKIDEAGKDLSPCNNIRKRISFDEYYLEIAKVVSKRSTCLKRQYGAVIVNKGEIIATGYNGSPRGDINCCDTGICKRLDEPHNSGNYDCCNSVHAEQNALISASRRDMIGGTLYLAGFEDGKEIEDIEPCPICARMIKNAGLSVITKVN